MGGFLFISSTVGADVSVGIIGRKIFRPYGE